MSLQKEGRDLTYLLLKKGNLLRTAGEEKVQTNISGGKVGLNQ